MPKKRYKSEEIVVKLRQVDVHLSQGISATDAIRQIGVSNIAYYLYGECQKMWGNQAASCSSLTDPFSALSSDTTAQTSRTACRQGFIPGPVA